MTKSERRSGLRLQVCAIAALFGVLSGSVEAADAAHTRARRSVLSAGVQETHGHIRETAATRRNERELVAEKAHSSRHGGKSSSRAAVKESARAQGNSRSRAVEQTSVRGRGRKQRELVVEHPVVMSRASSRRGKGKIVRETAAVKKTDAVETARDAAPQKAATVEEFLRAAKGVPQAPSETDAVTGVAKPDEGERIEAEVNAAAAKPQVATVKSAPVKKAPVLMAAEDTPPVAPQKPRVVEGFGGEVAMTQAPAPVTRTTKKAIAPVDEWGHDDVATKEAMTDEALKPVVVPLYSRSGRLITPAPLKGSREVLVHQNVMADQEGLSRIQDDNDLERMLAAHLLLRIPETEALAVNEELPSNRRAARPWTVKFVNDTSRAFYAKFHDPLHLSSAVRTVEYQLRLQRVNGNAASVEGETASPHLTGQAIDFAKSGMNREEIAWMRAYLLPIMQAGKIDVEEEFQQSCFHISVYAGYAPKRPVRRMEVAMTSDK